MVIATCQTGHHDRRHAQLPQKILRRIRIALTNRLLTYKYADDILIILAIGIIIHLTDQCFIDILGFFIIGGIAVDPSQPEVCNIVDLRLQVLPLLLGIGIGRHKFHADHLIKTGIGVVLVTGCPEKPAVICHHTAICLV